MMVKIRRAIRNNAVLLALVVMVCLVGCSPKEEEIPPIAKKVNELLVQAQQSFEAGDAGRGAILLLDVVTLVKPPSEWPEGFLPAIEQAKDQFQAKNLGDAVARVRDALVIFKPEKKERKKESSGRVAAVAAALKKNIAAVRAQFEKGKVDKGVIFILEGLSLLAPFPVPG